MDNETYDPLDYDEVWSDGEPVTDNPEYEFPGTDSQIAAVWDAYDEGYDDGYDTAAGQYMDLREMRQTCLLCLLGCMILAVICLTSIIIA